jgi:hypothetical protein
MPIDIIADDSEGAIATARITTSVGTITAMAEVALEGRCLTLRGLHVHGEDVGANELGVSGLRRIVAEAMEDLDVDEIVIEGAVRVTGASPGRIPRRLRFARKVHAEKRAGQDRGTGDGIGSG